MNNITSIFLIYLSLQVINGQTDTIDQEIKKLEIIFGKRPVGPQCECVPYYLCNAENNIFTDGVVIININTCPSYLDVCCNPADKTTAVIPTTENLDCGYRNPDGVGFRITGNQDNEAEFGEFPWMVIVLAEEYIEGIESTLDVYKCGGSLIHPQAVLTTAHCVSAREKKYKIRAGDWDTQTTKELIPHQERNVESTVIHREYDEGHLINDVAILLLESPLDITATIQTLCLPSQNFVVPSGTRCYVSGWGKDALGDKGRYQVILKKIDLPIVNREICENTLRKTRLGKNFILHKSFVCAGGEEGKSACKGDGGSPLACLMPGQNYRYQQVGMVAWGIGCSEDMVPDVYVNVAIFRSWIDEQLFTLNFNISGYRY